MSSFVDNMLDISLLGLRVLYPTGEHSSCDLYTTVHDPFLQFSQISRSTAEYFVLRVTPGEVIACKLIWTAW